MDVGGTRSWMIEARTMPGAIVEKSGVDTWFDFVWGRDGLCSDYGYGGGSLMNDG